jgi:acetyltransferase-like isoleucine patch superfamily enzyme
MKKIISRFLLYTGKVIDRILMYFYKSLFNKCGKNVIFFPSNSKFLYKNISIGNNVSIGYGATFIVAHSHITIGSNIMISSNVTIRGGTHSRHIIGKLMKNYEYKDKLSTDDDFVFIDDDVLVETGVIILKGVHIGRGAIIEAGSVVKENVPPYSIVEGVPAKIIGYRWSQQEILEHEVSVYAPEARLDIDINE